MTRFAALLLITSCTLPGTARPPPRAVGTLKFTGTALEPTDAGSRLTAGVLTATEAQVVTSTALAARIAERLGPGSADAATIRAALSATPREGTLLLEVGARDPRPDRALALCNAAMETYVEQRMQIARQRHQERLAWLSAQLDATKNDPAREAQLNNALHEEEVAAATHENDVLVLDRCALEGAPR